MSIRRTQQTVETLWRTIEMRGFDSEVPQRVDPEIGNDRFEYKGKPYVQDPSMNPPKLRGQGCCSKLLLLLLCSVFCSVSAAGLIAFINLPIVSETRTMLHDHFNSFSNREANNRMNENSAYSSPKQLPFILQRFRMINNLRSSDLGADKASLDAVFPEWRSATNVALGDLALGISALVEELEKTPENRKKSFPNASNTPFEQDTHANVM